MDSELQRLKDETTQFKVIVKRGAGLDRLWSETEKELRINRPDIVFIYGGVCDLTDLHYDTHGKRSVFLPKDMEARIISICDKHEDIASKFTKIESNSQLSFVMESGLDLIVYNGIKQPIPREWLEEQERLERFLPSLQDKARMLNSGLRSQTAWTLDATHARRGLLLSPVYSRLPDGLHPNEAVSRKLVKALRKAANVMLQLKSDGVLQANENHGLPVTPR